MLSSISSEPDETVPARRAITVRDLRTYRMGFGSDGPALATLALALDEWLRNLGSLPLLAQPGERWMYHVSGDVLGALIVRASGKSLGAFLRGRIFEPLGMKDTGFFVPPEKLDRLSALYVFSPETQRLNPFDDPAASAWRSQPAGESGAGGLVSTLDDYFAFSRMLLHKGRLGREQILSRAAVELMTLDQLTPEQRAGSEIFFGTHSSWGLGMAVDIARHETYHNPGRYGWTGGFGTTAYNDPAEGVIGILFTQRMMDSPEPPKAFTDFWSLAYGALE